jgi:hypothetical protein
MKSGRKSVVLPNIIASVRCFSHCMGRKSVLLKARIYFFRHQQRYELHFNVVITLSINILFKEHVTDNWVDEPLTLQRFSSGATEFRGKHADCQNCIIDCSRCSYNQLVKSYFNPKYNAVLHANISTMDTWNQWGQRSSAAWLVGSSSWHHLEAILPNVHFMRTTQVTFCWYTFLNYLLRNCRKRSHIFHAVISTSVPNVGRRT